MSSTANTPLPWTPERRTWTRRPAAVDADEVAWGLAAGFKVDFVNVRLFLTTA
jgi:hypothetical protein